MMTKNDILSNMTKARQLLDEIYYFTEDSEDDNLGEVKRLMSWADSCIMDAEFEVETYFNK
jgi:hypothetical protein